MNWHVNYFDPATGRRFDQGVNKGASPDKSAAQDWIFVFENTNKK